MYVQYGHVWLYLYIYIYIYTTVWRVTSGRRTPRRAADGRTPLRAADRRALYYGWAYILTLRGKGGYGGSPNADAVAMYLRLKKILYLESPLELPTGYYFKPFLDPGGGVALSEVEWPLRGGFRSGTATNL